MNTKPMAVSDRRVESQTISYQTLAEVLMRMQIEFALFAEETPNNHKRIKATTITTSESMLFHFEDEGASLSIDFVKKGGSQ